MDEENNRSIRQSPDKIPLFERPGRLDPERNVPVIKHDRVDVNIHYDDAMKTFIKDSDSTEFTGQSVNALDPFEDTALLNGEIKPKTVGVRTGAPRYESKIFVPETDNDKVKNTAPVSEPEQPFFMTEEDEAASSDYIADAFSGVETEEPKAAKPMQPSDDIAKLKMYTLLLGVVIVLEITGIALLAIL